MADIKAKWLAIYAEHVEPVSKEIFSYVEKMIIATLIISAGEHVSTYEPAIVLFGYLRHGLVGRGVEFFGIILLLINFLDGLHQLAKGQLAYRVPNIDGAVLHRVVREAGSADPRLSRGE
jgi:hypothetical protein